MINLLQPVKHKKLATINENTAGHLSNFPLYRYSGFSKHTLSKWFIIPNRLDQLNWGLHLNATSGSSSIQQWMKRRPRNSFPTLTILALECLLKPVLRPNSYSRLGTWSQWLRLHHTDLYHSHMLVTLNWPQSLDRSHPRWRYSDPSSPYCPVQLDTNVADRRTNHRCLVSHRSSLLRQVKTRESHQWNIARLWTTLDCISKSEIPHLLHSTGPGMVLTQSKEYLSNTCLGLVHTLHQRGHLKLPDQETWLQKRECPR